MKKYFLFFNLVLMFSAVLPQMAFSAGKKYRYIKREHGVRFQGSVPVTVSPMSVGLNFTGAYSYNWKGYVEVGPYFDLDAQFQNSFRLEGWQGGIFGEYNFIKNRGKRKIIPALGLKLGASKGLAGIDFSPQVYGSVKLFTGIRTPFILSAGYVLSTPVNRFFSTMQHSVDVSMGFAYYFDFY